MKEVTTITFEKKTDYYYYGVNDANQKIFDTSYCNRSEDARLSYLAGWASVFNDKNADDIQVI